MNLTDFLKTLLPLKHLNVLLRELGRWFEGSLGIIDLVNYAELNQITGSGTL